MAIRLIIALAGVLLSFGPLNANGIDPGTGEVWMLVEDFVKFGKKDDFEAIKKDLAKSYSAYPSKSAMPSIYCMQDLQNPEYHFLVPVMNYAGVDSFFKALSSFHASLGQKGIDNNIKLDSLVNFRVFTLMNYLSSGSYVPEGADLKMASRPFVRYYLYALTPGNEEFFENRLKKMAEEQKKAGSSLCWKSWKVAFGAEVPKYVIALFGKSKDELEAQAKDLVFLEPVNNNIIRREKVGYGMFRKDLSSIPLKVKEQP